MLSMEVLSSLFQVLLDRQSLPFCLILAVALVAFRLYEGRHKSRFPEANPKQTFSLSTQSRVQDFLSRSREILSSGRARYRGRPYRVFTDMGEMVVIPHRFIDELRNNPSLEFLEVVHEDQHAYLPGFEPFGADERIVFVVMKYLTKALNKLTAPISEEATHALRRVLTDSEEWHEMDPMTEIIKIVSQMSSRVFMGEELCRNYDWVKVSGEYTVLAFNLSSVLRTWPRWARPIVHWFMPDCWELRSKLSEARRLLGPHIEKRNAQKKAAFAQGKSVQFNDSLEWFEQEFTKKYDPATSQISLSLAAIHTTTDLLTKVMFDLAVHPELFKPLREEVVQVLGTEGLKKTALYNLKLMDSVIKETQRMAPIGMALFRRLLTKDIELSDGTKLYRGEKIVADTMQMWDSETYENPETYNGYRFLEMRNDATQAAQAHLVSTSSNHFAFGHGQHACPGRFFAANEIKIALCHLLLKYDWKLPEGTKPPESMIYGLNLVLDPTAKLVIRRRQEELDLDSLDS
ncbi:hypothetical protein HIM_09351 [Hirsutella minnesotensis 3608]|uniref:Uncharacterized protein n=1 Tax=Hirsutella minnesotensis 3608 TaxID=1043627 RepID=A0A0F7ZSF6_9HYPO|nr:hypothetical protein HIM_09351 [Hirsutella minnesotensis 3608]